jgi:hypothetical protein
VARARPAELTEELNEVWRLVVGYTKQETKAPLRGLGTFMRFGIVGMVLFAIGTGFGAVAVVRALQSETGTALTGYWSWVPYFVSALVCVNVGVLAARSVSRTPWKSESEVTEGEAK